MALPQIVGQPRSFDKKFKFLVRIDGIVSAAFQKCSELARELAVVEHFEGGALIPSKSPGRLTYPDITLERGAVFDPDLLVWFETGAVASGGFGLVDPLYKRTLTVVQQDRDNTPIRLYRVIGAWVMRYTTGDWDNTVDEVRIEAVTLSYDFWERVL